jgi:hypothetical protein
VDQPDLDRTDVTPPPRVTRLVHFVLLGALLIAIRLAVAPAAAPPPLVVEVAAGADDDAIRQATVDAILIEEAVRAGWPLHDPIVVERRDEVGGDAAVAHQLTSTDPVTRARLAWIGRELVRARLAPRTPTAEQLAAYRAAHADRYAPGWMVFHQRTIAIARHGARTEADAQALAARLAGADLDAPGGDPTLLPARAAGAPDTIDARFGAGFAAQVASAPIGQWSPPIAGTFGFHIVWREPAEAPETDDAPVARDWAHDDEQDHLRETIDQMLRARRIVVREVGP